MPKLIIIIVTLLLVSGNVVSQNSKTDSLLHLLRIEKKVTGKVNLLNALAYYSGDLDSSFAFLQEALQIADRNNYANGKVTTLLLLCNSYRRAADYQQAVDYGLKAVALAEYLKDTANLFDIYFFMNQVYLDLKDTKASFEYSGKKYDLIQSGFFERNNDDKVSRLRQYYNLMGRVFRILNQMDSSRYYRRLTYNIGLDRNERIAIGISTVGLAATFINYNPDSAFYYYRIAHECLNRSTRNDLLVEIYVGMSQLFSKKKMYDSAMYYSRSAVLISNRSREQKLKLETSLLLQQLYAERNIKDSAYKYLLQASILKDSLFGPDKLIAIQLLNIKEKNRIEIAAQQKVEAQQRAATNLKFLMLFIAIGAISIFAIMLVRNNSQKQKANKLLQTQKQEIDIQKNRLQSTVENLKATQAQLVQSEKMASLGELTAGIAHEIQNPLNFVNNFSEVSTELLDEMEHAFQKNDKVEVLILASEIKDNLKKIAHHGKRADAIVKGMLQHSRATSGQKELIDINALADEYLRLSYLGFRAKDKDFITIINTEFDNSIGKIPIVPQDIGRVLLNIYNNAFYACTERSRSAASLRSEGRAPLPPPENIGINSGRFSDFDNRKTPTIWVSTKKEGNKVLISVKDNGMGIPQKILDKIFQPFFTTKPTGQGTGLGLSLSYDIIKAHGGEIKVETKEGEGTTFTIQFPF